ncbi:PaaI family thioesterase [Chachezhania antarctica]|uniref:PaaI family thioesterase n=1 Tax=Chachezhania antarctica TaxID=2340860 RepID=UPI000EB3864D|nr:PaaI family thioesterase [Chachezhania antarctica]
MRVIEKIEDMPKPEEILALSGMEFIKGILAGDLPAPPIAKLMNYNMHEVEPGRVVFRGEPKLEVCNPIGSVHGGWYGTLLDSAMACAVQTMLPKGTTYTTLEYKINIIRSIPIGRMIDCTGWTDHVGRSTGVSHGEIRGVEDGKLYATGSTTCIVMTPPAG